MDKKNTPSLPLSVTRGALLAGGSDHSFREFVYNFFTVAERLQEIRRHLGARAGISGPQYSLMMAVAELEGSEGVRVGKVAEYLHVAGPFVTTEAGKLARIGYLTKVNDAKDKRAWRLSVTPQGRDALQSLFPELQQVNDTFFADMSKSEFALLRKWLGNLVYNSEPILASVRRRNEDEKKLGVRKRTG